MALEDKGIDPVSGRQLYYDTVSNSYELGPQIGQPEVTPTQNPYEAVRAAQAEADAVPASQINADAAPVDTTQDQEYEKLDYAAYNDVAATIDDGGGAETREAQTNANNASAALNLARQQSTNNAQRNLTGVGASNGDWRVKLQLAPNANYLYKAADPGILWPLRQTNGVIFPYTPNITVQYAADYSPYDLTHSNYRGFFYKGSRVADFQITGQFTAQDTMQADYLLAVIHFLRSATKMFYGQDAQRGAPPPLLYLTGLGEYQFNGHPLVINTFSYDLPDDVNYIRARGRQTTTGGTITGMGMLQRRPTTGNVGAWSLDSIWSRLTGAATSTGIGLGSNAANMLMNGAQATPPAPPQLATKESTYVPTKMSITLQCSPVQSRSQQSQQFSLKDYANGNLLKGGFW